MNENGHANSQPRVLIVDDVPANLQILRDALEPANYHILVASSGAAALRAATGASPDIILLDVVMPGMDGYEVCRRLKADAGTRHIPIVFVTVKDEGQNLVEGFEAGGVDYITKPFASEEVLMRVRTHLENSRLTRELLRANEDLRNEIARREQAEEAQRKAEMERAQAAEALEHADQRLSLISEQEAQRWGIAGFVGRSSTIEQILAEVHQLQSVGTTSVLITGESGTGKELIARAIHFGGRRGSGPFIPVNCSAIPSELAESAFFGHVRGAFSGANANRRGYFELAHGGTLFLDEIADMPLELQPKLLRVLEDGLVTRLGAAEARQVDVRILAATNQDLRCHIEERAFREDLYFRLARYQVVVPPLRERQEDIPLLAEHFAQVLAMDMGIACPTFSSAAMAALVNHAFPGNVRELKNLIENALIRCKGGEILPEHLHFIDRWEVQMHSQASPHRDSRMGRHSAQFEAVKELVLLRTSSQDEVDGAYEERIIEHVEKYGSISNSECRRILSVSFDQASYLLKKLVDYGLLDRQGERRWARYYLSRKSISTL